MSVTARIHPGAHRRHGVSVKVVLYRAIGLCRLPLLVLATWLAYDSVRAGQVHRNQEAANLAKNFAAAVDQHLGARIRALRLLAVSPLAHDPGRWPPPFDGCPT
jgi:hypothetical protein